MMASRHLRELLSEVQEPFVLKNYIDEKHNQLKRQAPPKTQLQLKRRNPVSQNTSFHRRFCKNACFLSFHDSPDLRKSPLFDLCSPVKSPCRSPNALLVQIPAHTAALLLERARRIQKPKSPSQNPKSPKNLVFGFFGSIMKKISHRKRNQKKEIEGYSVKDIVRCDSCNNRGIFGSEKSEKNEIEIVENLEDKRGFEIGFSCSSCNNNSRLSSIWSESNEEKSLDFDSSSCSSEDDDEDFDSCNKGFSSSPFRFVLQSSWSSPGHRTPEFASPTPSPGRLRRQVLEKDEGNLECEEENDQNSPVSVFDPPFEDDDNEGQHDDGEDEHGEYELEHSFAIVQRARQKFLHKLHRFERLAELDPVELEKKLIEDIEDEDSDLSDDEKVEEAFIREVLRWSNTYSCHKIPQDMKKLVLDLMAEERDGAETGLNSTNIAMKVCDRLDSWKEVEMNTIDMMVEFDFRRQADEWKRDLDQVQEIAVDIELAIIGHLVEELTCELCHSS